MEEVAAVPAPRSLVGRHGGTFPRGARSWAREWRCFLLGMTVSFCEARPWQYARRHRTLVFTAGETKGNKQNPGPNLREWPSLMSRVAARGARL